VHKCFTHFCIAEREQRRPQLNQEEKNLRKTVAQLTVSAHQGQEQQWLEKNEQRHKGRHNKQQLGQQ
jgi:hypothetical protein